MAEDFNYFALNPPIVDPDLFAIDQRLLSQLDILVDVPADQPHRALLPLARVIPNGDSVTWAI